MQFSYYFTAAAAAVKGRLSLAEFSDEALNDREVLAVAERVCVLPEREKDGLKELVPPIDVEILTHEGKLYRKTVGFVRGHPRNPAQKTDHLKKFDECAGHGAKRLSLRKMDAIKQMAERLQDLDDVTRIIEQLR